MNLGTEWMVTGGTLRMPQASDSLSTDVLTEIRLMFIEVGITGYVTLSAIAEEP